jgi:hypothetical protein
MLPVFLFMVLAVQCALAQGTAFRLVADGQPRATIVVSPQAGKAARFAAEELQRYVERITGAKLAIATTDDRVTGPRILVGRSPATEALRVDIPAGFTHDLKEEGYILKVVGDALVVAGNDDGPKLKEDPKNPLSFPSVYKGTLFAVYDLLERFGCRWYYPGEFGECVPQARDLGVPLLDVTARPAFPVRGFWYGLPAANRNDARLRYDMDLWMLRNKFLPYGSILPSAGDGSIMAPFRKYRTEKKDGQTIRINTIFEEHPEYFSAKADGSRHPEYLCLSNPEVVRVAAEYAIDYFRNNPDATGFGYAPPDGAPTCECAECRAANLGMLQKQPVDPRVQDISEGFYKFLDAVARIVEKEFPERWVTTTAYSGRIRPPEATALNRNISAHVALLGYAQHHRYDFPGWHTLERSRIYKRWGAVSRYNVERPYYPPFQFHCHVPQVMYRAHAFNVKELKRMGFAGSEWEARCAFMVEGLNIYVLGKSLWDTETDVEALLDEHYRLFYGAAAQPVKAFYDAAERALTTTPVEYHEEERLPDIYPHAVVVKMTDAVGDIEGLVKNADAATRQRVRQARLVVDHFRAYSDMRRAEAELDFALAAAKARVMIEQQAEITAMHPTFIDRGAEERDKGATYGELGANASPHGKLKQYLAKQALIDGTVGELAAALPAAWEFTTDPHNEGLIAQWYLPGDHERQWQTIDITRSFESQGFQDEMLHGYDGYAWYRVRFTVPERLKGKRLVLFVGGLNEQGWFWVNGKLAGSQPFHQYWMRWKYHHEVDITPHVKFGEENTLAVRIFNEQSFGGIFRRCFIYAPVGQ